MTHRVGFDGHAKADNGRFQWGWLNVHYAFIIEMLFLAVVLLNVVDYWTSTIALGQGFVEANSVVIALGSFLGLQTPGGLALTKVFTVVGGVVAMVFGIRNGNLRIKELAMVVMIFLATLLLVVSINNLIVMNA